MRQHTRQAPLTLVAMPINTNHILMKLRIKSTKLTIKLISWLQIVGGITGLGLIAYLMLNLGAINGVILLIICVGLGLFSYSIYTGKTLLRDSNKRIGVILSIINQSLQIFQGSILGYTFVYGSGANFSLGYESSTFTFNFSVIESTFQMSINTDDDFFVGINLIAVFLLVVLVDIWDELNENKLEKAPINQVEAV